MPGRRALAPAWLLCAAAVTACATPIVERDWIEVRSPNFVIWSAADRETSEGLVRDLEGFRKVVSMLTSIGHFEPRVPTRILVVPSPSRAVGLSHRRAGVFHEGLRENWAVVSPGGGDFGRVLYHEYTHFLLHNRDHQRYPAWFDEGFSELLSTVRIDGPAIEIGRPDPDRLLWLVRARRLPYERVLEATDHWSWSEDDDALFYAQSWALVHYLHWGRAGERSFGSDNDRFLSLCRRQVPVAEAFEQAFGERVDTLDERIDGYLRRELRYQRLTLEQGLAEAPTEARPLSRSEAAQRLGEYALATASPDSRSYFERALAEDPSNSRALAGLGNTLIAEGKWQAAGPYFERSIALDGEDRLNLLDHAEYLHDSARVAPDDAQRGELIRAARQRYERVLALDPECPEALVTYGSTFLLPGEDPNAGLDALEAAHRLLPGNVFVHYHLASAYAAVGRSADAIPLLEQVLGWSHGRNERVTALLRSLRGLEPRYPGVLPL